MIFFLQAEELRQPLCSRVSENNNHWGGVLPKKQQTALERGDVGKGSRFLLHTERYCLNMVALLFYSFSRHFHIRLYQCHIFKLANQELIF